jgi:hypothetical protein
MKRLHFSISTLQDVKLAHNARSSQRKLSMPISA